MKPIIFINSHLIQYFVPLYRHLSEKDMDVTVWYGSEEGIDGVYDKGFGTHVKWDIPLLEGYKSRFFKNHSWKPSHFNGFWGLLNLGMVKALWKAPPSVVVVHGWNYATNVLVALVAGLRGHTLCLRCEMPYNQELMKKGAKQRIKRWGLQYGLFPRFRWFLYIGTQNRRFYESYGIPKDRLLFCPYSVDNGRFRAQERLLRPQKDELKASRGIPSADKVILYSGKYIPKKRPMDIIRAFARLQREDLWLIMIGEGELRGQMENEIAGGNIPRILLTGFVNQSEIANYYTIGDLFVMCSTLGETWGLSVNEAMNFGLPLVLSETTGCSIDLVKEGVNGYRFETGDLDDLTGKLQQILGQLENGGASMGLRSLDIIDRYSFDTIHSTFETLVDR